jgi:hypothetical protein
MILKSLFWSVPVLLLTVGQAAQGQGLRWLEAVNQKGQCILERVYRPSASGTDLRSACSRLATRSWAVVPKANTSVESAAQACSSYSRWTHEVCADEGVELREPLALMRLADAPVVHRDAVSAEPAQQPQLALASALPSGGRAGGMSTLIYRRHKPDGKCTKLPTVVLVPETIGSTKPCSAVLVGKSTLLTAAHCVPGNAAVLHRKERPVKLLCTAHEDFTKVASTCDSKAAEWQPGCARDLAVCSSADGVELLPREIPERLGTDRAAVEEIKSEGRELWFAGHGATGRAGSCDPDLGAATVDSLSQPDGATFWQRVLITLGGSQGVGGDSGGPAFTAKPPAVRTVVAIISGYNDDPVRRETYFAVLGDQPLRCFLARLVATDPVHQIAGVDNGSAARWKCGADN